MLNNIYSSMTTANIMLLIKWVDDIGSDNQMCKNIFSQLSIIEGYKNAQYTEDSEISNVIAYYEWKESDIHSHLNRIQNIPDIDIVDARIILPA